MQPDVRVPFADTRPAPMHSTQAHDSVEQVGSSSIGRYTVLRKIGAGGMGVVMAARDPELDRTVAIKILFGNAPDAQPRLIREAQAMAKLSHPNVVTVHEVVREPTRAFIVMEFVDGHNLAAWQRASVRSWRDIVTAYTQAARGLAAAHQVGLVHRDFKPSNVLIDRDGVVRVTDFGLVGTTVISPPVEGLDSTLDGRRALQVELTCTGAVMGTPAYMAPEQHLGTVADARTDQWSFGCALYEALYGMRPFAGDSYAELAAAVTEGQPRPEPAVTRVPRRVRAAVRRMLARSPMDRFPTMEDVVTALAARRWRPRTIVGLSLFATAAIAGTTYAALPERGVAPSCDGLDAPFAATWNDSTATSLRTAFGHTKHAFAQASADHVITSLDAYRASWTAARVSACRAAVTGAESSALLDRRMRCLDLQHGHVRELVGQLATGQGISRAAAAVDALPASSDCTAARLPPAVALPTDPKVRAEIITAEASLEQSTAQRDLGLYTAAFPAVTAAAAAAERSGYSPLAAAALVLRGDLENRSEKFEAALATYDAAAGAAARAHDDEILARALAARFYVMGDPLGKPKEALAMRRFVELALERAGQPAVVRAGWLHNLGVILMISEDLDGALAAEQEALAIRRKERPPGHTEISESLEGLGNIYLYKGELDRAEAAIKEALEIERRAKGAGHPEIAAVEGNLANVHASRGDLASAIAVWKRVLETKRANGDRETWVTDLNLALALTELGRWKEAEHHALAAMTSAEQLAPGDTRPVAHAAYTLGVVLQLRGDLEGADRTFAQGARAAKVSGGGDLEGCLTRRARTAIARGDLDEARTLIARARGDGTGTITSSLAHALGDLARATNGCKLAIQHYESALAATKREESVTGGDEAVVAVAACHAELGREVDTATLEAVIARLDKNGADSEALARVRSMPGLRPTR